MADPDNCDDCQSVGRTSSSCALLGRRVASSPQHLIVWGAWVRRGGAVVVVIRKELERRLEPRASRRVAAVVCRISSLFTVLSNNTTHSEQGIFKWIFANTTVNSTRRRRATVTTTSSSGHHNFPHSPNYVIIFWGHLFFSASQSSIGREQVQSTDRIGWRWVRDSGWRLRFAELPMPIHRHSVAINFISLRIIISQLNIIQSSRKPLPA